MLTRKEIEKIEKQKCPDKRELHYPTNMDYDEWIDQFIDRNVEKEQHLYREIYTGCLLDKGEY